MSVPKTPPDGKSRSDRQLKNAAAQLLRDEALIATRTEQRVRELVESYERVPVADIYASVRRNLNRAASTLADGAVPAAESLTEAAQTTSERAAQELPVEDVIRGYRLSISVIFERFNEIAATHGISKDASVTGARLLWELGDAFISQVATAYQWHGIEPAVREARARTEHVRAILAGGVHPTRQAAWSVKKDEMYRALVASIPSGPNEEAVRRRLEATGGIRAAPAVVGVLDGVFAGYVTRTPEAVPEVVVALGNPLPPDRLSDSYALARQIFQVVERYPGGVFGLNEVGWRVAARAVPELMEHLRDRYIRPLREMGDFGADLEYTMRVFLATGRHSIRCADALSMHPNSLRYRLRKVSDILGVDLDDVDVMVELSMALESTPGPADCA